MTETKSPHQWKTSEKIAGAIFAGPIVGAVVVGLWAASIKFIQICIAWIS